MVATPSINRSRAVKGRERVTYVVFVADLRQELTPKALFPRVQALYYGTLDSRSTAAYGEYYSSLRRITVPSTAT